LVGETTPVAPVPTASKDTTPPLERPASGFQVLKKTVSKEMPVGTKVVFMDDQQNEFVGIINGVHTSADGVSVDVQSNGTVVQLPIARVQEIQVKKVQAGLMAEPVVAPLEAAPVAVATPAPVPAPAPAAVPASQLPEEKAKVGEEMKPVSPLVSAPATVPATTPAPEAAPKATDDPKKEEGEAPVEKPKATFAEGETVEFTNEEGETEKGVISKVIADKDGDLFMVTAEEGSVFYLPADQLKKVEAVVAVEEGDEQKKEEEIEKAKRWASKVGLQKSSSASKEREFMEKEKLRQSIIEKANEILAMAQSASGISIPLAVDTALGTARLQIQKSLSSKPIRIQKSREATEQDTGIAKVSEMVERLARGVQEQIQKELGVVTARMEELESRSVGSQGNSRVVSETVEKTRSRPSTVWGGVLFNNGSK